MGVREREDIWGALNCGIILSSRVSVTRPRILEMTLIPSCLEAIVTVLMGCILRSLCGESDRYSEKYRADDIQAWMMEI